MNFFKDRTTKVDDQIQSTFYPGMDSDADGIDLRIELNRILYGSYGKHPLGHWVIVRVFDRDNRSDYFNNYTKEGIMGPAHPYKDYLVKVRRVASRLTRNSTDELKPADIAGDKFSYYLEWTVPIKAGDQIFELNVKDHTNKPEDYKFVYKYDVSRIQEYRLENGNVQYIEAIGTYSAITY